MSARKNKSDVWKHFTKMSVCKSKCKICDKELPTVGGNTTGMRNHMRTAHPSCMEAAANPQPKLQSFGIGPQRPCSDQQQEKITDMLADVLAEHLLPLQFVESASLRRLLAFLEPNYKPPCRQTMTARMIAKKDTLAATMKTEMSEQAESVSITTDIWTSLTNEAYMSFTATYITPQWTVRNVILDSAIMLERHTLENIAAELARIAGDWGIGNKVLACVHDGASNVKQAGARNDWVDIHCAAHVLHLCVTSAMGTNKTTNKPIARCVGAASRLVSHFHHSPLATNALLKRQQEMKPTETSKKLVQHCKTRWNSAYDMMERLVELRWPVAAVLSDREIVKQQDAKTLELTEDQWELMRCMLTVLQPLQTATALLSAEKSPPASVCIPMIWGLLNNHLAAQDTDLDAVRQFKREMKDELSKRFPLSKEEAGHPFVVASILDPAHKHLPAVPEEVRLAAYDNVRELLSNVALPDDESAEAEEGEESAAKRHCPGLEFILGDQYSTGTEIVSADTEFESYLSDKPASRGDVLQWWAANATNYSRVAVLARRYLAIPPTSVASERVFSLSGRVITKTRNRLLPDTATCLVFLNKNIRDFQ